MPLIKKVHQTHTYKRPPDKQNKYKINSSFLSVLLALLTFLDQVILKNKIYKNFTNVYKCNLNKNKCIIWYRNIPLLKINKEW